jgi:RimJ/RimL family protein N-acetyltransferase
MKLLPLDSPELIELAAGWLARKENYQWLDFGGGKQVVTPALLKIMAQRDAHYMRVYTSDRDDVPIGIVGLNSVDRVFKTATFWGVSGEKSFRNRGYSTLASSKFLTLAFRDLGLHAVNTWAVEHNRSLRTIERLGFRFVGRQRQCHYIDGSLCDRLLFDLLASEHREIDEARWHLSERSRRPALFATRSVQPG